MPTIVIIISIILIVLIILAIIFTKNGFGNSSWKWKSRNEQRGRLGEEYVHKVLANAIAGTDAKLISDYMFQGQDLTVQIDHIVINLNGVYVIETKNWSGDIYGSEEAKEWTQFLANGNTVNKFRNPIKQNKGHIYNLSKILPKGIPFHNIVVMVQGNTQHIHADGVVTPRDLSLAINSVKSTNHLNLAQINKIYEILMKRAANSEVSNAQHVSEVKNMLADVERNICPRCKGNLVVREGKYGKFYGCSNYPRCTFKKEY